MEGGAGGSSPSPSLKEPARSALHTQPPTRSAHPHQPPPTPRPRGNAGKEVSGRSSRGEMRNLRSAAWSPAMRTPRAPTGARSRQGLAPHPAPRRPLPGSAPPGSGVPGAAAAGPVLWGRGRRRPPPPALTDLDLHALEDPEPLFLHRHAGSPARELAGLARIRAPSREEQPEPERRSPRALRQTPRAPGPRRHRRPAPPTGLPGAPLAAAAGAGRNGSAHIATPTVHWLRSRRRERGGSSRKTAPPPHWPKLGDRRGRSPRG